MELDFFWNCLDFWGRIHNKQVEAQRQHVLSAKNKSEEIVESLKVDLFNSVESVLNEVFNDLIQKFRKASKEFNEHNSSLVEMKNNLQAIRANI